jgi:hypothetical protein
MVAKSFLGGICSERTDVLFLVRVRTNLWIGASLSPSVEARDGGIASCRPGSASPDECDAWIEVGEVCRRVPSGCLQAYFRKRTPS